MLLRRGHRGGDHSPGTDSRRHGPSVSGAAGGEGGSGLLRRAIASGAGTDAGSAALPGATVANRHGDGGFHGERSGGIAPGLELSPFGGADGKSGGQNAGEHGGEKD